MSEVLDKVVNIVCEQLSVDKNDVKFKQRMRSPPKVIKVTMDINKNGKNLL